MKRTSLLMLLAIVIMVIQGGCAAQRAQRTGFLSDYSRLKPYSDVSYRNIPSQETIRRYSKFIVDAVVVHFHAGSKTIEERFKGEITEQDITDLKNYMHDAIVNAISDRYGIAYRPGPGVARVRIAITDLKKSNVLMNIHPGSKLLGSGLGGASLEVEWLDSQTGEQIAALLESQLGDRLSLDGLSEWGDAKGVMDDWARRFRERLDEAHGY
ncbi:MAG: DUF3313 domain-containing protein [Planctomycetota bacterium]|nr:MAG: DUF3313 domain-containing protein [Planctomycetota bacterium]